MKLKRGIPHVSGGGVSVHSSVSARSSREKKRGDLILITGQQSLFGPNVLVLSAQWTD